MLFMYSVSVICVCYYIQVMETDFSATERLAIVCDELHVEEPFRSRTLDLLDEIWKIVKEEQNTNVAKVQSHF